MGETACGTQRPSYALVRTVTDYRNLRSRHIFITYLAPLLQLDRDFTPEVFNI